jgi:hypothetical protein
VFVIWSSKKKENGGAHVTLWNRGKGVTAGGDATEQDSTIRRGWRRSTGLRSRCLLPYSSSPPPF